ncbi:MAG: serine/threonine protein kinase [Actinobacteria bacterium]|nr:MAG: serine/threonine protein kinase [Actinomycetota bacterium]
MSDVWRADDELLGRPVAVKLLTPTVDPALRAAIRREARAAARITHPHVTQVYDYGEAELAGGEVVPYLVMELVDGRNLAERLEHGPLSWAAAARVVAQIATGLAAAHRLGVVHRDIKPGNIMLTSAGVKILDFGIAALADGAPDPDGGWLIGTPAYAAPERFTKKAVNPAADVYALGALFYECLTGRPPLTVTTWAEAAQAHREGHTVPPPSAPDAPSQIVELCLACLAPDPDARPRADALAADLNAALSVVTDIPDPVAPAPVIPQQQPRALPETPAVAAASVGLPRPRYTGSTAAVTVAQPPRELDIAAEPYLLEAAAPRSRLTTVVVTCGVIIAGISVIIASAAFLSSPQAPARAGSASVATAPGAGTALSDTPNAALETFQRLLTDAQSAGLISEQSAQPLRQAVRELHGQLAKGQDTTSAARNLRQQIGDGRNQGTLPAELASRLELLLVPLLASD